MISIGFVKLHNLHVLETKTTNKIKYGKEQKINLDLYVVIIAVNFIWYHSSFPVVLTLRPLLHACEVGMAQAWRKFSSMSFREVIIVYMEVHCCIIMTASFVK